MKQSSEMVTAILDHHVTAFFEVTVIPATLDIVLVMPYSRLWPALLAGWLIGLQSQAVVVAFSHDSGRRE